MVESQDGGLDSVAVGIDRGDGGEGGLLVKGATGKDLNKGF